MRGEHAIAGMLEAPAWHHKSSVEPRRWEPCLPIGELVSCHHRTWQGSMLIDRAMCFMVRGVSFLRLAWSLFRANCVQDCAFQDRVPCL